MFPNENISAQTSDLDTDAVTLTGLSEDEVLELFGEPQSQRSNLWLYEDGLRVWFNDLGNAIAATRNGIDAGEELQLVEQAVVLVSQQKAVLDLLGGPVVLDMRVVERALSPEECPTVEPCFEGGPNSSVFGPHTLDVWQDGQLIYSEDDGAGLSFPDDLYFEDITGRDGWNFFMDSVTGARETITCVYEIVWDRYRNHDYLRIDFVECVRARPEDFIEIDESSRFPGLEVMSYDPNYSAWPGSYATAPSPPVTLAFDGDRYVPSRELMVRPIEEVWLKALADFDAHSGNGYLESTFSGSPGYTQFLAAETTEQLSDAVVRMVSNGLVADNGWPAYCETVRPEDRERFFHDMPPYGSVLLFDVTFELIYTGHWSAAWQFFDSVWPETAEWSGCESMYREDFLRSLAESWYGAQFAVENGHMPAYYTRVVQLSSLARSDDLLYARVLPGSIPWPAEDVDDPEAVRLLRLAAEEGDVAAQVLLAGHYVKGLGARQDFVLAHKWLNVAAAVVSDEDWCSVPCRDMVVAERDRIDGLLTATQRAEAQRLAREWDEAHPQ